MNQSDASCFGGRVICVELPSVRSTANNWASPCTSNMNQNSPQDVSALLGDVNELADNSHCHIDTSHIVSVSSKAFVHHDESVG